MEDGPPWWWRLLGLLGTLVMATGKPNVLATPYPAHPLIHLIHTVYLLFSPTVNTSSAAGASSSTTLYFPLSVASSPSTPTQQQPPQCHVVRNQGMWQENFTRWEVVDKSSRDALSSFLHTTRGSPTPAHHHHYLFIGDSTMARLYNHLPLPSNLTLLKQTGHCGLMDYYGFAKPDDWVRPDPTMGEGPGGWVGGWEGSPCSSFSSISSSFI